MLAINNLLEAVDDEAPCGDDLEFNPLFSEMERAKRGTDTQQIGDSIKEGEPPDWRLVKKNALLLLQKTHDIRIATSLSIAMLNLHSFAGFAEGLELLAGLLQKYWDCIYPEHDPYDDYPIERVNTLSELGHNTFVLMLKKHPLVAARGLGQFSFYDIQFALENKEKSKESDVPDTALIHATFKKVFEEDASVLQETAAAVSDSLQHLQTIKQILQDKIKAAYAPDLSKIIQLLTDINKTLREHLPEEVENIITDDTQAETSGLPEPVNAMSTSQTSQQLVTKTTIENRKDVNQALDKIQQYYEQYEPSSPVPLLLKRAQYLVDKSFVEVMQDLSPNSVDELLKLFGTEDKNE